MGPETACTLVGDACMPAAPSGDARAGGMVMATSLH